MQKQVETLKERLKEIYSLSSAMALLGWDQQVHMPKKGVEGRSLAESYLGAIIHKKYLEINHDGLLDLLRKKLKANKLNFKELVIVRETLRYYDRDKKLPTAFIRELIETESKAYSAWEEAKRKNNFKIFLPWLEKIVKLKRQEAKFVGYKKSPYDALLDVYEPGMTAEKVEEVLDNLKSFIVPFVKKIRYSKVKISGKSILGNFPVEKQRKFNRMIAEKMGFNFEAGRMDESVHPFTSGFHPYDVRITSRYYKNDLMPAIFSTVHETGHALYEQGYPAKYFGTPLAESVSLGIHESQSRLWENIIGRSLPFWKYFYPKLQKEFPKPFKHINILEFYRNINKTAPSLIRVESDEVTYNLHIIIRFEIEKMMIERKLKPADAPKIWNKKVKEYLGINVPDDGRGILQDVHWSGGSIGYFPTYTLGNLYAAQIFDAMRKEIPNIDKKIVSGDFKAILKWLRKKIHVHGKSYAANVLIKKISGEELNSGHFIDYLTKKYSKIYRIK